jgi:hypothetical protein
MRGHSAEAETGMLRQVFRRLRSTALLQVSGRRAKNSSAVCQLSRNQGTVREAPNADCRIESCFNQVQIVLGILSFYAHSRMRSQKRRQSGCNPHPAESAWQGESQKTVRYRTSVAGLLVYPPDAIGPGLLVFHPRDGGSVDGPEIHGVSVQPGGDWLRMLPDGSLRIGVRVLIKLDGGSTALMTYGGILAEAERRELEGLPRRGPC